MKLPFVMAICTLLALTSVSAAELTTVTLLDQSGQPLTDVIAHITTGGEQRVVLALDGNIILDGTLVQSPFTIHLEDPNTEGMDYFYSGKLDNTQTAALPFIAIAPIRGSVQDDLANLVRGAQLEFDCDKPTTLAFPEKTDKYGSFTAYVPTGRCVIAATNGDVLGTVTVTSVRGEPQETMIVLNQPLSAQERSLYIFGLLILVGLILYFMGTRTKKRKRTVVQKPKESRELKTILKTLGDKERAIVDYVIEQNNVTTSSKVRHALGIPKTTLTRILDKLEAKRVLEITREGKLKRLQLAEWLKK